MKYYLDTPVLICLFNFSFLTSLPLLIWAKIVSYIPRWQDKLRLLLTCKGLHYHLQFIKLDYVNNRLYDFPNYYSVHKNFIAQLPLHEIDMEVTRLERAAYRVPWSRHPISIPLQPEYKGKYSSISSLHYILVKNHFSAKHGRP